MITSLTIENFRGFKKGDLRIAPITIFVGENSTGKSSALAAIRLGCNVFYGVENPDFNEPPFQLGGFKEISTNTKYSTVNRRLFSIKSKQQSKISASNLVYSDSAKFIERQGRPLIAEYSIEVEDCSFVFKAQRESIEVQVNVSGRKDSFQYREHEKADMADRLHFAVRHLPFIIDSYRFLKNDSNVSTLTEVDRNRIAKYVRGMRQAFTKVLAIAPIRESPKRTYDVRKDKHLPEGGHMPAVLAKTFAVAEWDSMYKTIAEYASESGLFSKLSVKKYGDGESDPFQIQVQIDSTNRNIVDVGFGVGQILPLLVDITYTKDVDLYLLQQPEVHLHPRAQAELGSFLANVSKVRKCTFVVETHSDYFLKRVLMSIASGILRSTDVSLHYFSRKGNYNFVQEIGIDSKGMLVNVPDGYRDFFLEEELKFLGV